MPQARIPAVFMRGGTSKAIVFRRQDLPADPKDWDIIFLQAMGSPDPNGRQLDGMGGGISSLSKVCVVGPASRDDADVDYTFAQVSVDSATVDYSGNCGNMSSAIGPFAVDEGLVPCPRNGEAIVRIHNTNTAKVIHARFPVDDGVAAIDGEMAIDGVAGRAAPIRLEFREPGGAKTGRLLPTGRSVDRLEIEGLGAIEASLVDAANPCVFVRAADLGKRGDEAPEMLENDPLFTARMEAIRRAASVAMGIGRDPDHAGRVPSVPKAAIISAPMEMKTLSGRSLSADEFEIGVRMISIGRPHRAIPITGAICVGVAARIEGSLPNGLAAPASGPIRIAHPSGIVVVDAEVTAGGDGGEMHAEYGAVFRTARRLFDGHVCYRPIR